MATPSTSIRVTPSHRAAKRYEKRKAMFLAVVHLVFEFLRLRRLTNVNVPRPGKVRRAKPDPKASHSRNRVASHRQEGTARNLQPAIMSGKTSRPGLRFRQRRLLHTEAGVVVQRYPIPLETLNRPAATDSNDPALFSEDGFVCTAVHKT